MKNKFSGILPAIASPCDDNGSFLEDAFISLAHSLYNEKVHGLYVCGVTGDGYNMSIDDRKRAAQLAVEVSREFDGTVIVHVGALNTSDPTELAQHAAQVGANAIASIPPASLDDDQLISYYSELARAAQMPVFVYYIPGYTGVQLSLETVIRLLDVKGVIGLKFSDYNIFLMKQLLLARPDTVVFNGEDQILCPGLLYGASGGIGMTYNLFPKVFVELYQAVCEGDILYAMQLQERYVAFLDLAIRVGLMQVFEYMLKARGFGPRVFRVPKPALDEETLRRFTHEVRPIITALNGACR